jgi:hypothetical protein
MDLRRGSQEKTEFLASLVRKFDLPAGRGFVGPTKGSGDAGKRIKK